MEIEEALTQGRLVTISNIELVEICWLLDLSLSESDASKASDDDLDKVRAILIEKDAVLFNCSPVTDLQNAGSYKILSGSHGFFKGTPYESQAFIQICLDDQNQNSTEYGILAITTYNSSEFNRLWLKKYNSLKYTPGNLRISNSIHR